MKTSIISTLGVAALVIISSAACTGRSPILGNKLNVGTDNGKAVATLVTKLNTSNMSVTVADLPVMNPKNPAQQLGRISVSSPAPGETDVKLTLDLGEIVDLPATEPATGLPNGTAFPVSADPGRWLAFRAGSQDSRLYLNVDLAKNQAVVGYALSSDGLSTGSVGNVFYLFSAGAQHDVSGAGGIYSGQAKGQSGFALFADLSGLLGRSAAPAVHFGARGSQGDQAEVYRKLFDLNDRKARIRVK